MLFKRIREPVKTPKPIFKEGDLVSVGLQYGTLEVVEVYKYKEKYYIKCKEWLTGKYFGDLQADKVVRIEE